MQKSLSANPLPGDITSYKHLFDTLSTARKTSGIRPRGKPSSKRRQPLKALSSCRFPPRPGRFRVISNPSPGSLRGRSLPKTAGLSPGSLPLSKTDRESPRPFPPSRKLPDCRRAHAPPLENRHGVSGAGPSRKLPERFRTCPSLENRRAVSKTPPRANPVPSRIQALPSRHRTPSKHFP